MEIKIALCVLVPRFRFRLDPTSRVAMALHLAFRPEFGMHLIVTRR
jgi:hypothetical protein